MSDREIMNAKTASNKKSIIFRDPVVERVVDKFVERSDLGFKNTVELYMVKELEVTKT